MDVVTARDAGGERVEGIDCDPKGRPLGELLVLSGLVSEDEVARALAEQERSRRRLGEILVEQGAVPRPLVRHALTEQGSGPLELERGFGSGLHRALVDRHRRGEPAAGQEAEPAPEAERGAEASTEEDPPQASVTRMLGELLVASGLLGEDDVAGALAEQRRSGLRLGEILLARGAISRPALGNALVEQQDGEVALEAGFGTGLRAALLDSSKRAG